MHRAALTHINKTRFCFCKWPCAALSGFVSTSMLYIVFYSLYDATIKDILRQNIFKVFAHFSEDLFDVFNIFLFLFT